VKTIPLPAKSPNLNAFAERWGRSVKQECLSKVTLFGAAPLSRVLAEYSRHYHHERNHQGKGNRLPFPEVNESAIRSAARSNVVSDSAVCSNTIDVRHEYFYHTTTKILPSTIG
jgi:transposase InsO family protein